MLHEQDMNNIIASIRDLSKAQIRWIINTTLDPDHVGNNEKMSNAGRTVSWRGMTSGDTDVTCARMLGR